ncbi:hypothetical protein C6P42_000526 [Pichia californica]|nr:hypothetical protein C6P42_000526 [[Candida] californica]
MTIGNFFSNLFKFRKTSLSLLVILTYVTVIILQEFAVVRSLTPPIHEPDILKDAWDYLQIISSSKHPFTSRENDNIHDYLQNVIDALVEDIPYISTSYDKSENHTILINQHDVFNKSNDDNRIIYYESSNLLVKIEGSNSKLPGLLISAHYDSVPTSFGTTDDGMGIASMLGILQYFVDSNSQPLRTLIFNFNNNEEFGLLGAEAFIKHDWFKDVSFFINLEGTGAGGQPILFRGTDKGVLDWYHSVSKPYANSIFQEGFNSGLISSQTDYHVYEKFGLRGIDIAFYKPRSFYHTYKDSIKYTSKGSLWMMMSNVLDILLDVNYSSDNYDSDLNYSIYFDILNTWYFNYGLDVCFIFNSILLIIIPVINLILLLIAFKRNTWYIGARGWLRFPFALILSYYSTFYLRKYLYKLNPLLVSVNYYYPLIAFFSLSVIISYIILKTNAYLKPIHDQKLVILLELNIISWISLVWITFQINNNKNMGGYSLTIFYVLSSIATFLGLLGFTFHSSPCYKPKKNIINYGSTNDDQHLNTEVTTSNESNVDPHVHNIVDESVENQNAPILDEENTPLVNESSVIINHETKETFMHNLKHKAINSFQFDWILQFLIFVPISVFFIYSEGKMVIDALHETVQENKIFDTAVWDFITAFSILLSIIIMPFIHKMNFITIQIMVILFSIGFFKSSTSVSYDESTPIKLRYVKTFDVNSNSSSSNVYGRQGYIPKILSDVPYLEEKNITCMKYNLSGTETCSYVGNRPWLIPGSYEDNEYDKYLNVTVLHDTNNLAYLKAEDKFTPLESVIEIDVRGTRQCYITFNNTNEKFKAPVKMVTIYEEGNSYKDSNTLNMNFNIDVDGINNKEIIIPNGMSRDDKGNWRFKIMKGIDIFEMHKLSWNSGKKDFNRFLIKFQWLPFVYDSDIELIDRLGVNVQCHWSDYDDIIPIDGKLYEKVEDYMDLMMFTDVGVTWTNLRPGLVQGMSYVEI